MRMMNRELKKMLKKGLKVKMKKKMTRIILIRQILMRGEEHLLVPSII